MRKAVVISGVRTPIGRYGGVLSHVRPDDLAALAVSAAVERAGVEPSEIDDVYFGAANEAGAVWMIVLDTSIIAAMQAGYIGGSALFVAVAD